MSQVNTDKLVEDLKVVIRDAEELLRATAGQAGEKFSEVRARAEESLQSAKSRLREISGDLNARAHEAADRTDQYVRTNPWAAIGIAAVAGLVLAALLSRREGDG